MPPCRHKAAPLYLILSLVTKAILLLLQLVQRQENQLGPV